MADLYYRYREAHKGDFRGCANSAELLATLFDVRKTVQTVAEQYHWEEQVSYFLACRSFTREAFEAARKELNIQTQWV